MNSRILLLNPKISDKSLIFSIELRNPVPHCLGYMARMAQEEGFDVKVLDENYKNAEKVPFEEYDVVCMPVRFFGASRAREVAASFRKRGKKAILHCLYPTFSPSDALKYTDAIMIGEPDDSWKQILKDLKKDQLRKTYKAAQPADLKGLPVYDKDVLPRHDYCFPMEATRGCRFNCDFCAESKFHQTFRTRPIDEVVRQIEAAGDLFIHFMDTNIVADPAYAKELFRAMRSLSVQWGAQASITMAKDEELIKLAADSGCVFLLFGLESTNMETMKEARKGWARPRTYPESIRRIQEAGIGVIGSFVFGFDSDTGERFQQTLDFVYENNIEIAHFLPLTPIAGTSVRRKLEAEGRMIELDEGEFAHSHVSFHPKRMTKEELEEGIRYCWKQCYSKEGARERLTRHLEDGVPRHGDAGRGYSTSEIIYFLDTAYRKEVKKRFK